MKALDFKVEFDRNEKEEAPRLIEYAKYTIKNQMLQMLEMKTSQETSSYKDTFAFRMKAGDAFYNEKPFKELFRMLKEALKCPEFCSISQHQLKAEKMDVTTDSRTWVIHYECNFTEEQKQHRAALHVSVIDILVQYVLLRVRSPNVKMIKDGILYQQDPFEHLLPGIAALYSRPLSPSTFDLPKEVRLGFRDHFKGSRLIYDLNIVKNPSDFSKYVISFKMDVVAYLCYDCIYTEYMKMRYDQDATAPVVFRKAIHLMAKGVMDFTFHSKLPLDKTHGSCLRVLVGNIEAISNVFICTEGMLNFTIDGADVPKKRLAEN